MSGELKEFSYLISQVMKNLQNDLEKRFREKEIFVTYEQWTVISCFCEEVEAGYSQQEIADKTGRDQPCTSRLIDNLVKQNILIRVPDERDRRVNKIFMTEKGKELAKTADCIAKQVIVDATDGMKKEELNICKKVLQEVNENIGRGK